MKRVAAAALFIGSDVPAADAGLQHLLSPERRDGGHSCGALGVESGAVAAWRSWLRGKSDIHQGDTHAVQSCGSNCGNVGWSRPGADGGAGALGAARVPEGRL